MSRTTGKCWWAATLLALAGPVAASEFQPDQMGVVALEREPGPHWVWVDDINFFSMADGRAYLVDVGTGDFLGMISTGGQFMKLDIPRDRSVAYAAGSYFERLVRGKRTDVLTMFDPRTLEVKGEIEIPAKRLGSMPTQINSNITDDQQFLVLYNMTPAQSATVVDLKAGTAVSEVITAGCAMIIPGGPRRFRMICADGSLMTIQLDDAGQEASRSASERFFDPQRDPVSEKPVRLGDDWLFVSFDGWVHAADLSGEEPRFAKAWSLLTEEDRAASWRPGGGQHLGVHQGRGLLFSLMHQGGADSHKDPGTEVWVYDVSKQKRVQRIVLKTIANAILLTQDASPLMVTSMIGTPALEVYGVEDGQHQRTIAEIGSTITLLQNY